MRGTARGAGEARQCGTAAESARVLLRSARRAEKTERGKAGGRSRRGALPLRPGRKRPLAGRARARPWIPLKDPHPTHPPTHSWEIHHSALGGAIVSDAPTDPAQGWLGSDRDRGRWGRARPGAGDDCGGRGDAGGGHARASRAHERGLGPPSPLPAEPWHGSQGTAAAAPLRCAWPRPCGARAACAPRRRWRGGWGPGCWPSAATPTPGAAAHSCPVGLGFMETPLKQVHGDAA